MRLYSALVKSVLLYGAETWTKLKSDEQRREAFHMSCQCRILGICWYDFTTNAEVVGRTHQVNLATQIQKRRLAVSGRVRRLPHTVPAHTALCLATDDGLMVVRNGSDCEGITETRGQVEIDISMSADTAWNAAADCDEWRALRPTAGHGVL